MTSSINIFQGSAIACAVILPLANITMFVMGILGLANVVPMSVGTAISLVAIPIPFLGAMLGCCCRLFSR